MVERNIINGSKKMKSYNVTFQQHQWRCTDGCCSGEQTVIFVNEVEIGVYDNMHNHDFEGIKKMLDFLNEQDEDITLMHTILPKKDGKIETSHDLKEVIYLNEIMLTDSFRTSNVYGDILDCLKLPYHYIVHEVDWDYFFEKDALSLVIKVEEMRNG